MSTGVCGEGCTSVGDQDDPGLVQSSRRFSFNVRWRSRVLYPVTRPRPHLVRPMPGPLSDRSDDELMTLAQAGVRDAFAVLVERHGRRIVQLCSRFVDDPEIGQEIAQETWLTVWSQRGSYQADGKFIVWLIAIRIRAFGDRLHPLLWCQRRARARRSDPARVGNTLSPASPHRRRRGRLDRRDRSHAGYAHDECCGVCHSASVVAVAPGPRRDGAGRRMGAPRRHRAAHWPDVQRATLRRESPPNLVRDKRSMPASKASRSDRSARSPSKRTWRSSTSWSGGWGTSKARRQAHEEAGSSSRRQRESLRRRPRERVDVLAGLFPLFE
jgi:hypothetical protein